MCILVALKLWSFDQFLIYASLNRNKLSDFSCYLFMQLYSVVEIVFIVLILFYSFSIANSASTINICPLVNHHRIHNSISILWLSFQHMKYPWYDGLWINYVNFSYEIRTGTCDKCQAKYQKKAIPPDLHQYDTLKLLGMDLCAEALLHHSPTGCARRAICKIRIIPPY